MRGGCGGLGAFVGRMSSGGGVRLVLLALYPFTRADEHRGVRDEITDFFDRRSRGPFKKQKGKEDKNHVIVAVRREGHAVKEDEAGGPDKPFVAVTLPSAILDRFDRAHLCLAERPNLAVGVEVVSVQYAFQDISFGWRRRRPCGGGGGRDYGCVFPGDLDRLAFRVLKQRVRNRLAGIAIRVGQPIEVIGCRHGALSIHLGCALCTALANPPFIG